MNRPVVNDDARRLSSTISAVTDTGSITFDPTGGSARRRLFKPGACRLAVGLVTRSGCGRSYDCSVKIGRTSVAGIVTIGAASKTFGTSDGFVPVEGSYVIVLLTGESNIGYIVGVIPQSWRLRPNSLDSLPEPASYPNELWDPFRDNSSYNMPFKKEDRRVDKVLAPSNRRRDLHPGESATLNENSCGITHGMYGVELSGGASFIRVSRLDDEIRMRSTNFQKWTDAEFEWGFNDGGLISVEGRGYSYQGELLGSTGRKGPEFNLPKDTEKYEPRPRVRSWKGFLGNLFSWFAVRARTRKDADDEEGLVSLHVSQGGNVMVRSAGGVSLERYPRIPVPHRLAKPWDPKGDKELEAKHEAIESFAVSDPHARALAESSKMAWEQKSMYQRFDELKKDFSVKQESGVKAPGDHDGDPFGSSEIRQSECGNRKAGVFVGEDGSVIVRDAWGSEIVMLGGNIFLNTPGNIVQTAHGDSVTMAGGSAVIRGVAASEMSSDEGHVRIHAKELLSMAGGYDGSKSGGVLIESLSTESGVSAMAGSGNMARIGGVVIRAEKSSVYVGGESTYVSGKDAVLMTTGPSGPSQDDKTRRSGRVLISSGDVMVSGKDQVSSVCGASIVSVSGDGAVMESSGSALVYGASGASIISRNMVPVVWFPIPRDKLPDISYLNELFDELQNYELVSPYDWNNMVKKAVFSFRTSMEAGTDRGMEPWRRNREFTLYEPHWQVMLRTKDPIMSEFDGLKVSKPVVRSVHGTACWPGGAAIRGGKFVKYGSGNVENGFSRDRDSLGRTVAFSIAKMSEFTI